MGTNLGYIIAHGQTFLAGKVVNAVRGMEFCLSIEKRIMDNRNNSNWEQNKNQQPQENQARGSKEQVSKETPDNRLKDGTNDLQSGDQEPNSENKTDRSEEAGGSSQAGA